MGCSLTACGEEPAPAESQAPAVSESPVVSAPPADAENQELIIYAAASLTETLTELGDTFEEANPGVEVIFNFDSSGKLKSQIEAGADCDLFLSASPKQMNALDIEADAEKNPDGLDFVDSATRLNLLENKVTLAVPAGNPKGLESFDQLAEMLNNEDIFLSMGNADVPVGQYTLKIFDYYGLDEAALAEAGKLTYGTNVKEVTTQVTEASVDCGIIYATDAVSAGLEVVDEATAEMCGQVIYPAAVLKTALEPELAANFLTYLQSDEAMDVFGSVGFAPAN